MAGVSDSENKWIIRQWLVDNRHLFNKVLDIGAGVGTYSIMGKFPEQHWTALEVFEPYIEMFNLRNKYEEVVIADAREYEIEGQYDLIIAADMLEHMKKQEAKDLIAKILKHCKTALICVPMEHNHQEAGAEGNVYETHVDHWHFTEMSKYLKSLGVKVIDMDGKVSAYFIVDTE